MLADDIIFVYEVLFVTTLRQQLKRGEFQH